ncbi:hypothetical protein AGABI1DRAFT_111614 [Agaricus bisporus var. burnettii JB137-S8]|uniref:Uncharacterized protein n=1 Tax=Agaricus bisporus var. burnettii (strain JB137-S8 / ATCC MYA-4627 / FGSC 10392) TaxID=597362 RepID=K5XI29_AGABU|nr:uncharacterized protein AGABI1DRAFT_111614 [Agaricus bisporus var. burnettii JB137-S8]EKM83113.1 hypothetical protein AGABI1DRAFT_111614 [Agaricus bisporus var. burnettii JB137-S8]
MIHYLIPLLPRCNERALTNCREKPRRTHGTGCGEVSGLLESPGTVQYEAVTI